MPCMCIKLYILHMLHGVCRNCSVAYTQFVICMIHCQYVTFHYDTCQSCPAQIDTIIPSKVDENEEPLTEVSIRTALGANKCNLQKLEDARNVLKPMVAKEKAREKGHD